MDKSSVLRFDRSPPEFGVVDLVAQQDVSADEQLPCDSDFRTRLITSMQHALVKALQIRIVSRGCLCSFDQEIAGQSRAVLADRSNSLAVSTGIFHRIQTNVGRNPAGIRKAIYLCVRQL